MTRLTQSDIHPDADSLSAFAEHALPEVERASVVSHLADCSRCREVVFLAQAVAESESPAAVSLPFSQPLPSLGARLAAFLNPLRHAWVSAAALASIGIVTALFILRPNAPTSTIAQNSPREQAQASSPAAGQVPAVAHDEMTASAPPPAAVPGPTRKSPGRTATSSALRVTRPPSEPILSAPAPSEPENSFASDALLSNLSLAPPPSPVQPEAEAGQPGSMSLARASVQPVPPQPARNLQVHGSAVGAAAHASSAMRPPVVQPEAKVSAAPLALFAPQRPVMLPNGLISVSTAVAPGRLLALDPDGALFLSRDAGNEWESIPSQWSGKALKIMPAPRTFFPGQQAGLSGENANNPRASFAITPAPEIPALKSSSPALFRLVNDRRQVWISDDGKLWRPESAQPEALPRGPATDQP